MVEVQTEYEVISENLASGSLKYPVLQFRGASMFPARNDAEFITCSKTALKSGYFSGLLVVDSGGQARTVKTASKLRGVGALWGYNLFLNQKITVAVAFEPGELQLDSRKLKDMVQNVLRGSQTWSSSSDNLQIAKAIEAANTAVEIIEIIVDAYYPEKI